MSARSLLSVTLGLFLWILPSLSAPEHEQGECLLISDIHFNPFADPSLFAKLAKRPALEWPQIFESSLAGGVSQLGSDSNYTLLKSSLSAAAKACPRPDFVLYIGDSLAHNWKAQYEKAAGSSSGDDIEAYQAFTTKTVEFLAREFQKHFANVPILPTLGNEDAYCGDYKVQPAGAFLSMFAQAWLKLAGSTLDKESFQQSFSRGGYYSMLFSPLFRHRIIVLNSVFFSTSYENACGSKTDTPGDEQLGWLTESLETAARANEKVWLVMHIPVGINDYNTIRNEAAASAPVEFWRAAYSTSFVELLSKYRQTVQVVFSGHTHMDDFRIIESEKTPLAVNKLIPSISPVFKNNPGFQVYQYDRAGGTIENYQTYYLANLSTAGQPTELEQLKWNVEYDFRSAYRQRVMDVSAVGLIARMLRTSAPIQELYMRLYSVSGPPAFDKLTLPAYTCAILHTTIEEFEKCQQDSDDDAEMRKAGETMQPAMNIEMK